MGSDLRNKVASIKESIKSRVLPDSKGLDQPTSPLTFGGSANPANAQTKAKTKKKAGQKRHALIATHKLLTMHLNPKTE